MGTGFAGPEQEIYLLEILSILLFEARLKTSKWPFTKGPYQIIEAGHTVHCVVQIRGRLAQRGCLARRLAFCARVPGKYF